MFIPTRSGRLRAACIAIAVSCGTLFLPAISNNVWADPLPTNNDPANQIRFHTPAEANAKRSQLINFIWSQGLPRSLPTLTKNVELPKQATDIDRLNVARVDRLDANVSGWDFHAFSYLLHPTNTASANRVVIVHHGHSGTLDAGVGSAANHLLQNGFTVVVMQMPLVGGWNTDNDAVLPDRGTLTYKNHDEMILKTAVNGDGHKAFGYF